MIGAARIVCLLGLVLTVYEFGIECSPWVEFDQRNSNVTEDEPLRSVPGNGSGIVRVPLERRKPRSIDASKGTPIENALTIENNSGPGKNDTIDSQMEITTEKPKKGKKKTSGQKKKNKEWKKSRRHIDTSQNFNSGWNQTRVDNKDNNKGSNTFGKKDPEYYAKRKRVMDRYYERIQQIEEKYKKLKSSTVAYPEKINLPLATETKSLISPAKINAKSVKRYGTTPITTHVPSTTITTTTGRPTTLARPLRKTNMEGDCRNLTNHSGFYENHLSISVFKGSTVEMDLSVSTDTNTCLFCVLAHQLNGHAIYLKIRTEDLNVKLSLTSDKTEEIQFHVLSYSARKPDPRCAR